MARNPRSVRFPPALEEQVQAWADEHLMPFNRAVVELLGRAVQPTVLEAAVAEARQVVAAKTGILEIDHADGSVREVEPRSVIDQARLDARPLAGASGKCSADAPRGTVCKVCGKKH